MKRFTHKPTVLIIGGDKRNQALVEMLKEADYDTVYTDNMEAIFNELNRQVIILPLPVTKNGTDINCINKINLVDIIKNLHPHSRVLCGGLNDEIRRLISETGAKAFDYYNNEKVLTYNAYLTAEGTVKLLIENTDNSIIENKILVIGSGRCGKSLAYMLKRMDCDVTLASRKKIKSIINFLKGIKSKNTAKISQFIGDYEIVVNTAPSLVLDRNCLTNVKENTLIIELASQCAGIDMNEAINLGINVIYAPALPGKYSYISAAKILYKSISKIIREEFA